MRIGAGRWRGAKLRLPQVKSLQPSKGFVREVLFNWLADDIKGSTALDCFAGSGALAIEAVSRGARFGELWEIEPKLLAALRYNCGRLAPEQFSVLGQNAYARSPSPGPVCDIVFLDPPFDDGPEKLTRLVDRLALSHRLRAGSRIYIEQRTMPKQPHQNLHPLRERRCGGVSISLWSWNGDSGVPGNV